MKMHEMDLMEFLIKEGHTDIAESIKDYRKNTIKICVKNVGNIIEKAQVKSVAFLIFHPKFHTPQCRAIPASVEMTMSGTKNQQCSLLLKLILRTLQT